MWFARGKAIVTVIVVVGVEEEEEDEGSFCKISCSSSSYKLFTISLSDSLSLCVLCSCGELRREMVNRDRKSTRLNSSHSSPSRMPSSA